MPDLVLLCRHVRAEHERTLVDGAAEPEELLGVVGRLRETLAQEGVALTTLRHAPSPIATAHATWLRTKLARPGHASDLSIQEDDELKPERFMTWTGIDPVDQLSEKLVGLIADSPGAGGGPGRAVLVVGHMPQLGWLAVRLMRNRPLWSRLVDGYLPPFALKNAEVAAIALTGSRRSRPRGELRWTVAPDDTHEIQDLRDKIKSKMEVAKLLGGFMTLVLGGVVLVPDRLEELSHGGTAGPCTSRQWPS